MDTNIKEKTELLSFTKKYFIIWLTLFFFMTVVMLSYNDMIATQSTEHEITMWVAPADTLPLPPYTVYCFRSSSVAVTYETETKIDDIIAFYKELAESNSFSVTEVKYRQQLNFIYKGYSMEITIGRSIDNANLYLLHIRALM